jgi:hypothetical protein
LGKAFNKIVELESTQRPSLIHNHTMTIIKILVLLLVACNALKHQKSRPHSGPRTDKIELSVNPKANVRQTYYIQQKSGRHVDSVDVSVPQCWHGAGAL